MTDHSARPRLTVPSPDVLPVAIPHLLGFVPGRSLVVVGLARDSSIALTLRVDIPPDGFADWAGLSAAWGQSFSALVTAGADTAVVLVYPADEGGRWPLLLGMPHAPLVERVTSIVEGVGVRVLDALCVVADRHRSYLCESADCCPPEGRRVPEPTRTRVEAVFVAQGSAPLRSRLELESSLDERPDDDAFRQNLLRARDGVVVRLPAGTKERVEAFVRDVGRWGERPGSTSMITRLVVTAGVLVADIPSRDLLLQRLAVQGDRDVVAAARQVLGEAVRCARGEDVAQPAATLAMLAWSAGDGAAARVAVVRSLAADPACSLARLVESALDGGLPPWGWRETMQGLSDEEILGGGRRGQERSPA